MSERSVARMTGWAGIVTALLAIASVVAIAGAEIPQVDDGPRDLAADLAGDRRAHLVSLALGGIAWCGVFLVFLVGLRSMLRRADDEGTLATIGLAGGLSFATVLAVFFLAGSAAVFSAGSPDDLGAKSLWTVTLFANNLSGPGTAVCLGGFCALILRTRAFPAWIGWYGLAVGALHLVTAGAAASSGAFSPGGALGLIAPPAFTLWMVAVSVVALRRPEGSPTTGT